MSTIVICLAMGVAVGLIVRMLVHSREHLSSRKAALLGITGALATGAGQRRGLLQTLDPHQLIESLLPATTPEANAVTLAAQTFGDHFVLETFEREQNDLGPMGESLRTRTGPDHRLEHFLLTFGDDHFRGQSWHDVSSGRTSEPGEDGEDRNPLEARFSQGVLDLQR